MNGRKETLEMGLIQRSTERGLQSYPSTAPDPLSVYDPTDKTRKT